VELPKLIPMFVIMQIVILISGFMVMYNSVSSNFLYTLENNTAMGSIDKMSAVSSEFAQINENSDNLLARTTGAISGAIEAIFKPLGIIGKVVTLVAGAYLTPLAIFSQDLTSPTYIIYIIITMIVTFMNLYLGYQMLVAFGVIKSSK